MSSESPDPGSIQVPELTLEEEQALAAPADAQADNETEQFRSGKSADDLAQEARENEHGRSERFKDHFESLARCGITVAFSVALIMGLIWSWHVVAPPSCRWLKEAELDHLQNLITGGVLASVAGDLFRKRLG